MSTTTAPEAMHFEVRRDDLRTCRVSAATLPAAADLADGEALLAVDRFAFTANNVTYGVIGEMFSYWSFFPADAGWGRIPVWGFADVTASRAPGVAPGERFFGYLPMSTHLVVRPAEVAPEGFVDASAHRAALPPVYNRYVRVPPSAADAEDRRALFQPLFMTGYLIDQWLADADFFGADAVAITSASSKTAMALAFNLSRSRRGPCRVVGLTSARNAEFVRGVGFYDDVLAYDAISQLPADRPTAYVDMAGSKDVLVVLHRHLRDRLVCACLVGIAHWEEAPPGLALGDDLPGARPALFFAPAEAEKRMAAWGVAGFHARVASALDAFIDASRSWMRVQRGRGPDDVERVYRETLEGRVPPDQGHVLSLRRSA
jgi:hypothetical protein